MARVVVEIKVAPQYDKRDEAQLLNELKATGLKVGLLINFGRKQSRVQTPRLLNPCFIRVHPWLTMNLSPEKKIAGVLVPLFALRGRERSGNR